MTFRSRLQSRSRPSGVTKRERLIEPRLQASLGSSGNSPQGFVASMRPQPGVGLSRLTVSMKQIPGSPVRWLCETIRSQTSETV